MTNGELLSLILALSLICLMGFVFWNEKELKRKQLQFEKDLFNINKNGRFVSKILENKETK